MTQIVNVAKRREPSPARVVHYDVQSTELFHSVFDQADGVFDNSNLLDNHVRATAHVQGATEDVQLESPPP
jgi:hypothetical protein